MDEEEHKALVVRPSAAVQKIGSGAGSVLSPITSDALPLARSRATSLASARFRVGKYEFREADYQQILLWAKALEKTPEEIIGALDLLVRDGSIFSLVWNNKILPLTDLYG
jgi:hypothetical protein